MSSGEIETVPATLPPAVADAESLRQAYAGGVEQVASPPGPALWFQDGLFRLLGRVAEWIEGHLGIFDWLRAELLVWGLRALLALLALFLVLALVRWLWLRRPVPTTGDGAVESTPAPPRAAAPADRDGELRRRLAAGDPSGALEALWWWLADALDRPRADPAWTSRELLARAGRMDLRPDLRDFDRLAYGLAAPSVDEVRELWHRLQSRLPREASDDVA